ncbi:hypothetical protein [Canibacter zhoujuaniae]|uniref:hypothetical protein n=1 Tax=Canibacter zhoujuaniae TaxID=2708343 RepID=UPI0014226B5F|nr:hypothetical protein [Canibacter zhoujuaniae]
MSIKTSVKTAVTAIFTAVISFFIAVPAHASGGGDLDTLAPFNRAGEGHNYVAIIIVAVVLLAIVLGLSTAVSNLFKKSN